MRTKEEILGEIDKSEVLVYKFWVEVLIDIRDILAEAYTEKIEYKLDEDVNFEQKDRTADEWLNLFNIPLDSIIDPYGWDRENYEESWNEKISLLEMNRRVSASTVYLDRFKDTLLSYKNHIELEEQQADLKEMDEMVEPTTTDAPIDQDEM